MGWVSWPLFIFVLLAPFSALWWPNIWMKMGFLKLSGKIINPIHFIPGIYPYGVSMLMTIHFHVPSQMFGRNWGFWNFLTELSAQLISYLEITLMGWVSWRLFIFCVPSVILGSLVAKYLAENGVSITFFKKLFAQFISYLKFTLMGWVSWSLFIFVFLSSILALWWPNTWPKNCFPVSTKNFGFLIAKIFVCISWTTGKWHHFIIFGHQSFACIYIV